jgi:hypothetical protein
MASEKRRVYTWRGPYHRYVDFKIIYCSPGISEDVRKSIEEDLKDPDSEIRRDIRKLFEADPPGVYKLSVLVPPFKAGCLIQFRKVR